MPGEGKYTSYSGLSKADQLPKANFLKKLFGSHVKSGDGLDTAPPQVLHDPADEDGMRKDIIAISKAAMQPAHQIGDMGFFPTGVDMQFQGAPDISTVKWDSAGDAANPYAPDISSPGPGKTEGTDKDKDPQIQIADLKPNYVPGAPNTGTKSPIATVAKIIAANILGVKAPSGDSGGNV